MNGSVGGLFYIFKGPGLLLPWEVSIRFPALFGISLGRSHLGYFCLHSTLPFRWVAACGFSPWLTPWRWGQCGGDQFSAKTELRDVGAFALLGRAGVPPFCLHNADVPTCQSLRGQKRSQTFPSHCHYTGHHPFASENSPPEMYCPHLPRLACCLWGENSLGRSFCGAKAVFFNDNEFLNAASISPG